MCYNLIYKDKLVSDNKISALIYCKIKKHNNASEEINDQLDWVIKNCEGIDKKIAYNIIVNVWKNFIKRYNDHINSIIIKIIDEKLT